MEQGKIYAIEEGKDTTDSYAGLNNITVYGSYDSEILNIEAEDVFDGIHLRDDRVEKACVKR